MAAVLFCIYTLWSVTKHLRMESTGYDLGIFEQAVRGYAGLGAPISQLKGPGYNLLGDHFHPILIVLAPVYRLLPSPLTLLTVQALLLAVSAIPVTRLAVRRFGTSVGTALGLAYGLSWGIQQAVNFDFHEIAFAVPLIAFSLERLLLRHWLPATFYAVPLVLVKEDLGLTIVAAIGFYLLLQSQYKLGAALIAFGATATAITVLAVIPAFNPSGIYPYLGNAHTTSPLDLFTGAAKYKTIVMLLAPTAFLAWRSPLLVIAVPTLACRFWSPNPTYWGSGFHYNAVLMPIVFIAFLHTLNKVTPRTATRAVACSLAITAVITTQQPLARLTDPNTYRVNPALRVLDRIPDDATVAASNHLIPQLTHRATVSLFPNNFIQGVQPEWIAVLHNGDNFPANPRTNRAIQATLPARGYQLISSRAGIDLYHRLADRS